MADQKITALTSLGTSPDDTDVLPIVDVSDTTQAASGTTKEMTISELKGAIPAPLTTKGDIYTYSSSADRLPVGTNGQILSADSNEATGLKWIAAGGGGDLLAANNLSDVNDAATSFNNIKQSATTSATGVVELATTAETQTGTDATRAVTPDGLNNMTDLSSKSWFLDEDTMSSDDATKVASQQSVKAYVDTEISKQDEVIGIACSDETTDLTTGTAKTTFRMPFAMTLTEVRANVNTAPTGSALTVDINESGSTILSTKLTIDAGEKTSETAATPPVISDSALADDAEITIDIDAIGSTVAGTGLKIWLIGTRT